MTAETAASTEFAAHGTVEHVRAVLEGVVDPEIPVLSIADLGVLREVRVEGGRVSVTLTPTYSGCPAMDTMRADVLAALAAAGYPDVEVSLTLSPAWSTDWMSPAGRRKLVDIGIAPPPPPGAGARTGGGPVLVPLSVRCPHCGSANTRETSRFGSTACKSLWVCQDCREPFDHFKAL